MDCSLWLNRKKISSAAQIPDNLDVASLRGYFLGGSLIEWLEEHDGGEYASKLAVLSHDDPSLNEKIARIFGGTPLPAKPINGSPDKRGSYDTGNGSLRLTSYPYAGSSGSFRMPNSFRFSNSSFGAFAGSGGKFFAEFGSFLAYLRTLYGGSFAVGSFKIGKMGNTGSYGLEFEWEWLWEFFREYSGGSFVSTSFSETSFLQWEWLWEFFRGYSGGSFVLSSFSETSFSQWEWLWEFLRGYSGGSFTLSSYFGTSFAGMFGRFVGGSFPWGAGSFPQNVPFTPDEYDLIMFKTLLFCPLDRFGYGIHII